MSNGETDWEPPYPVIVTPVQLAADPMLGTTWDGESLCQCGVYMAIQVYRGGHTTLETLRGGVMAYGGAAGALAEFRGGEHALVCGELRLIGGVGRKAHIAGCHRSLSAEDGRTCGPTIPLTARRTGQILKSIEPSPGG